MMGELEVVYGRAEKMGALVGVEHGSPAGAHSHEIRIEGGLIRGVVTGFDGIQAGTELTAEQREPSAVRFHTVTRWWFSRST